MPRREAAVLVTCEHGGNRVSAPYRGLFRGRERVLMSHRGWDPGALVLARELAAALGAPLIAATVSRLVVDLNRSEDNPSLLSKWTAALPEAERERLLRQHYWPYRERVEAEAVRLSRGGGRVVHISVHTFTPVLRGERRAVDVGLLFDPAREGEVEACRAWRRVLVEGPPPGRGRFNVRENEPYLGTDDGLTTYLRTRLPASRYVGIELEVNQRFPRHGGALWERVRKWVVGSARRAVAAWS